MFSYIGLGSNLNKPEQQIKNALLSLSNNKNIKIISLSGIYKSKPFDSSKQPDYLNAVCKIQTSSINALDLLSICQDIEQQQHRVKLKKWGARTIDLDILLFGDKIIKNKNLIVPHPEMANRDFVLVPLIEITPKLIIPTLGSIDKLIKKLQKNINLLRII